MAKSIITPKFYVYQILVDGIVRYIGKGSGGRIHHHVKFAKRLIKNRKTGKKIWARKFYNQLAKAIKNGSEILEEFVIKNVSEKKAFAREIVEIVKYPEGQLWNTLNGGPGNSSEYTTELWKDPIFRAKQAVTMEARIDEAREDVARARTIRWEDPKQRKLQSEIGKVNYVAIVTFRKNNPSFASEMTTSLWKDEIFRAKVTKAQQERYAKPGSKIKLSKSMKLVWADQERRVRVSEKLKAFWAKKKEDALCCM